MSREWLEILRKLVKELLVRADEVLEHHYYLFYRLFMVFSISFFESFSKNSGCSFAS
jgi:hypothetical protein